MTGEHLVCSTTAHLHTHMQQRRAAGPFYAWECSNYFIAPINTQAISWLRKSHVNPKQWLSLRLSWIHGVPWHVWFVDALMQHIWEKQWRRWAGPPAPVCHPPPTAKRAKDEMWVSALWIVTLRTKSSRDSTDLCPLFIFFGQSGVRSARRCGEIHLYLWGLGQKERIHPFRTLCFTASRCRVMNCSASIHCQKKTNNLYCGSGMRLQVTGTEAYCDFILWSSRILLCKVSLLYCDVFQWGKWGVRGIEWISLYLLKVAAAHSQRLLCEGRSSLGDFSSPPAIGGIH